MKFIHLKHILFFVLIMGIAPLVAQKKDQPVVDKVIAVIADQIVLQSDLEGAIIQYASSGKIVGPNSHCLIFEDLLFNKLLMNQAALDSLVISEDQINGEISRRIAHFVQKIGSEEKLEEFYGKSIPEIKEEFYGLIEEQMLTQQMQGRVTGDIDISPKEVKLFFNKIPEDSLPFINSEVVVEHIVIDPIISSQEKADTRKKIEKMRQRVLQGEDFGTLAFLYSQDPGSARQNGELGFMERGQLVREFAQIAFSIQPGQVSEVFESEFGFHIVQLIERRGQQANVRHILLKPSVKPADLMVAKNKLDSIRNLIMTVDSIKFETSATKFSDDKSTRMNGGKLVNPQTGSTTFPVDEVSKVDPTLFYILDKMEPGEISNPVVYQKMNGSQSYRIVKLVSATEAHRANLKTDYIKIQGAAKAEKEKEAMEKWIKSKIEINYIRIDETLLDCEFQHSWF